MVLIRSFCYTNNFRSSQHDCSIYMHFILSSYLFLLLSCAMPSKIMSMNKNRKLIMTANVVVLVLLQKRVTWQRRTFWFSELSLVIQENINVVHRMPIQKAYKFTFWKVRNCFSSTSKLIYIFKEDSHHWMTYLKPFLLLLLTICSDVCSVWTFNVKLLYFVPLWLFSPLAFYGWLEIQLLGQ